VVDIYVVDLQVLRCLEIDPDSEDGRQIGRLDQELDDGLHRIDAASRVLANPSP